MEFREFINKEQELLDQKVLVTIRSNGLSHARRISTISKINKNNFEVEGSIQKFDFEGKEVLIHGKIPMTKTECKLLTDEQCQNLLVEFSRVKEINLLKKSIISGLDSLTYEQLLEVNEMIVS